MTIPPGSAGVLVTPSGVQPDVVEEGVSWIGPLSHVDVYDMRGQERTEDLAAIAADGAPVEARASLVTYSLVRRELPVIERNVGPDYYNVIIAPVVRATVRLVLARYRSDELTPDIIRKAQAEVTALVAERVAPFHLIVTLVDLRTLDVVLSQKSYRLVTERGVAEQVVLTAPQRLALAREHAEARRILARSIAATNTEVGPGLSPEVLSSTADRAWTALVTAPSSTVIVPSAGREATVEISP